MWQQCGRGEVRLRASALLSLLLVLAWDGLAAHGRPLGSAPETDGDVPHAHEHAFAHTRTHAPESARADAHASLRPEEEKDDVALTQSRQVAGSSAGAFVVPGLQGGAGEGGEGGCSRGSISQGGARCGILVATPGAPPHGGVFAEPHKPTTFSLTSACSSGKGDDVAFRTLGPGGQVAYGSAPTLTFTEPGRAYIEVSACPASLVSAAAGAAADDAAIGRSRSHSSSSSSSIESWCSSNLDEMTERVAVAVTYVRREIRQLSARERGAFFDAIRLMANTSTADGRAKYGPRFESYYDIVARHAAAVLAVPCDVGHWGPALLTFHRAFSRLFENSLQAVNPELALPYWDMFIEGEMEDPSRSELFSDALFGSLSGDPSDSWILKDGQFAYWKVPGGEEALRMSKLTWGALGPSNALNPYGFARRPDNMNRAPSITRISGIGDNSPPFATRATWRACQDHDAVGAYKICLDLAGGVHSSPHMAIGGVSGLPTFADLEPALNCTGLTRARCLLALQLSQQLAHASRGTALADGCLVCGRRCASTSQPAADCNCRCQLAEARCDPAALIRRTMGKMRLDPDALVPGVAASRALAEKVCEFGAFTVCTVDMRHGDYFDPATAASDPIFWVHHSNFDRLLVSWRAAHANKPWAAAGFTFPSRDPAVYPDFLSPVTVFPAAAAAPAANATSASSDNATSAAASGAPAAAALAPPPYPGVIAPGDGNPSGVCDGHGLWDVLARGSFVDVFDSLREPHDSVSPGPDGSWSWGPRGSYNRGAEERQSWGPRRSQSRGPEGSRSGGPEGSRGRGWSQSRSQSESESRPHTNLDILRSIDVELRDVARADYIYDAYER